MATNYDGLLGHILIIHQPHPEGMFRERAADRLIEDVSLMDAPAASEGACDDGQPGAGWLSSQESSFVTGWRNWLA